MATHSTSPPPSPSNTVRSLICIMICIILKGYLHITSLLTICTLFSICTILLCGNCICVFKWFLCDFWIFLHFDVTVLQSTGIIDFISIIQDYSSMRTSNLVLIVESKRQPETPPLICCMSKVKSPTETKGEDTISDWRPATWVGRDLSLHLASMIYYAILTSNPSH